MYTRLETSMLTPTSLTQVTNQIHNKQCYTLYWTKDDGAFVAALWIIVDDKTHNLVAVIHMSYKQIKQISYHSESFAFFRFCC